MWCRKILITNTPNGPRTTELRTDCLLPHRTVRGEIDIALSAVSAVELTHGIYRARTDADRTRRRVFVEGVFHDLIVHPLTLEIA